jgi:predicted GIY-YIG superfamily endonuclease
MGYGLRAEHARTVPHFYASLDRLRTFSVLRLEWRVHFVYIVRCADGTLYTGYARDPLAREKAHNSGRGARYTSGRRPVRLVYTEACESRGAALSREHQLKGLRRMLKEALIAGQLATDSPPRSSPADSRPRVR